MSRAYINDEYVDVEDVEALELPIDEQISALKAELVTYDYIGTKIAMGVASKEEYTEQIAYTEKLRAKIRELEGKI